MLLGRGAGRGAASTASAASSRAAARGGSGGGASGGGASSRRRARALGVGKDSGGAGSLSIGASRVGQLELELLADLGSLGGVRVGVAAEVGDGVNDGARVACVRVDQEGVGAGAALPLEEKGHTLERGEVSKTAQRTEVAGEGEVQGRTAMMLLVGVFMLKGCWARAAPAAARRARTALSCIATGAWRRGTRVDAQAGSRGGGGKTDARWARSRRRKRICGGQDVSLAAARWAGARARMRETVSVRTDGTDAGRTQSSA